MNKYVFFTLHIFQEIMLLKNNPEERQRGCGQRPRLLQYCGNLEITYKRENWLPKMSAVTAGWLKALSCHKEQCKEAVTETKAVNPLVTIKI